MTAFGTTIDGEFVEQVGARARAQVRDVRVGRLLLTWIAAVLFAIGWLVAKCCIAIVLALVWAGVAVKVGWTAARSAPAAPPQSEPMSGARGAERAGGG